MAIKMKQGTPAQFANRQEKQLITAALKSLERGPKLKIDLIGAVQTPGHPDFAMTISSGRKTFKVLAEVKSPGEPSVLRRSAAWLKDVVTKTKHDYGVIIAPFISKEARC